MSQIEISKILVTTTRKVVVNRKTDLGIFCTDIPKSSEIIAAKFADLQQQADKLAEALRDERKWLRESLLNKEVKVLESLESRIEIISQLLTEYDKSKQ